MNGLRRWLSVLSLVVVLFAQAVLPSPQASAQGDTGNFVLNDFWWPTPVVEYRVNLQGAPPGALQAVQAAAQSWNDLPESQVELRYVGSSNLRTSGFDGVNVVYWEPLDGQLGQTRYAYQTVCVVLCADYLLEADIAVAANQPITVGALGTRNYDLESLMLHEFGHMLGLNHADRSQVMYERIIAGTERRTPASGDRRGVEIRYPNSNGDVNCDGLLNILDAYAVAQFAVEVRGDSGRCPAVGRVGSEAIFALMGDANSDGVVNIVDAYLVARCAVGLEGAICPR